ncbi:MAG TPA: hypothetical protein VGL55_01260 [Steroidobacteraceae bacterium]
MIERGRTRCRLEGNGMDRVAGRRGQLRIGEAQLAGFLQPTVGLEVDFHIADPADVAQLMQDGAVLRQQEQQRDS